MNIFHKIRDYRISKKHYNTMNWITIQRDAICHNFLQHYNTRPNQTIIPVLKSNAYGHGLKQLCNIIDTIPECHIIAVDSYPEYLSAYHHCTKDILLLNETEHKNYAYFDYRRTMPGVYTLHTLRILIESKKPRRIHLFLNTGMNREGLQMHDLTTALSMIQGTNIQLIGVMSHFSHADDDDGDIICERQISRFKEMYSHISDVGYKPRYIHINNSSGFVKNTDPFFNTHRIGKGLYGFFEYGATEHRAFGTSLRMALDVYSTVLGIQTLHPGEGVGYSHTRHSPTATTIATIPFGYYEGLTRLMSNNRSVEYNGRILPVVGNISMNLCSFNDTTNSVSVGDCVKVISSDIHAPNNRLAMSRINNTISREILVKINASVRKRII